MFGGFIVPAVFQVNARVLSKRHQVREQKTIGGLDEVFGVLCFLKAGCAARMAREGQGHVATAPIVASPAPLFRAGAVGLRACAIVEEKSRVAFQRGQHATLRENPRGSDEVAGPRAASFGVSRVEEDEILPGTRLAMIAIRRVEITDVRSRIFQRKGTDL